MAEDIKDQLARRPSFEDKLARAIDRVSRGTYLPSGMYAPARDPLGQFAGHGRGPLDDYGRCSSRFHDGGCFETLRSAAATSDATAVERWNATLRRGAPVTAALLANSALEDAPLGPSDLSTLSAMRSILGTGGPR